jgi:hypothetical protein
MFFHIDLPLSEALLKKIIHSKSQQRQSGQHKRVPAGIPLADLNEIQAFLFQGQSLKPRESFMAAFIPCGFPCAQALFVLAQPV